MTEAEQKERQPHPQTWVSLVALEGWGEVAGPAQEEGDLLGHLAFLAAEVSSLVPWELLEERARQ